MIKIHFYIRFNTRFGESLQLLGNIPQLGNLVEDSAVTMNYLNEEYWSYVLELSTPAADLPAVIQYKYLFKDKMGRVTEEWDDGKVIALQKISAQEIHLQDTWNFAGQYENVFFTSPFQEVLLPTAPSPVKPASYRGNTHVFKVKAPLLQKDEVICLLGGAEVLAGKTTGGQQRSIFPALYYPLLISMLFIIQKPKRLFGMKMATTVCYMITQIKKG